MNIDSLSLTLEQEFQMRLVEDSVQQMNRSQMGDLIVELARIVMIKDNAIQDLLNNEILPNLRLSLTLEQEFQMEIVEDSIQKMNRSQIQVMLIELAQALMLRDNEIRDLLHNKILPSLRFEEDSLL
ncbi:hypothetical protein TUMEXPCC7403_12810 [Tumidithrix helvetica PCC 7403]|uniref:NblA/ycf18 family protein n=1 Tax=Tumidithrix helvetica TaxID=3457545 RepID=UPI003CBBC22D